MVYQYEWSGFKYAVPAEVVGAECERIEKENGSVTCECLVDAAREKTSSIHNLFEWNDSIAGEKWRISQARTVLSCLKVVVIESEEKEPKRVRAFLNAETSGARAEYFNIEKTMSNIDLMMGVLNRAKRELQAFVDKYRTLKELNSVINAIDEYLDSEVKE